MAPRPLHPAIAHYNGTLQWHPAMAPRPLNHSTLQWHPAMAPSNGTTSTAPSNGTLQWHSAMAPRPLNHSTLQWHPAMAPNGTQQWHPAMAPRPLHPAMAFWCHVQCAKVVRRPPPLLEVRTPIAIGAIAIWGKKTTKTIHQSNLCHQTHPLSNPETKTPPRCGAAHKSCVPGVFVQKIHGSVMAG